MVDPVDADAGRRERTKMRVGLRLAPGDVRDPELASRVGPERCGACRSIALFEANRVVVSATPSK
jgi:hypothetical protein